MSGERLPGFGTRIGPRTCPACGTHIAARENGTVAVRIFMSLCRVNPDGTETGVEPVENRMQHYHYPCWCAAIKRFNGLESDAFRTGNPE